MTTTNLKTSFNYIVIAALVLTILLQRQCAPGVAPQEPVIITKVDTIWKKIHDTVKKNVPIYVSIPTEPGPEYIPSSNLDSLRKQYLLLRDKYLVKNVYVDTIKLDTFGIVQVVDTVQFNKLKTRVTVQDYKIPTIIKETTIIKKADPVRQLYVGSNLFGNQNSLQAITPGLIYKTKKDQIYQANVGVNFDGSITYGLGMYWKIKLRK
jgi:hypothetical protein